MLSTLKRVCVIAAHPDDEILGCGGTIKKLADNGCKVNVLILGEGITSRNEKRDVKKDEEALQLLKQKAFQANKLLGVESVTLLDFPDNRFDSVDLLDIVKAIEGFLSDKKTDAIFTHHHGDLNIDHQITCRAVLTACRPSSPFCPNYLFSFEVLSSTEWNFGERSSLFTPNVFVGIDEELTSKIKAMNCYDSETKPFPFARSPEAIEHQARNRGTQSSMHAAEAFDLRLAFP